MTGEIERTVHVVDDDQGVRDGLSMLLRSARFAVETYSSGPAFLARAADLRPGCVLLDIRMPEMSGLELQQELRRRRILLPVIVMTGHGDVAVAVQAMKAGAVDFVEKPFDEDQLLGLVEAALAAAATTHRRARDAAEAAALVATLSHRERDVLDGLVSGRSNKQIAFDLDISPRTVEIYRANMMEKLQARTVSAAVRVAILAGVSVDEAG
ncbi:LuxR family two component transcriptional regulator [Stella humosa]|uniref:LuxR family two component transcriptional regulator n=1 Tax=Stella humosa TaxID=94 RepID=A0A3N1KPW0_9PROT|nr:response regulator FixJ [Stella humosa]ROP81352.1 LuxR family two component transcriptional regulator [Stella humosa]BBK32702.1 DNA-binding response regulator [Stella humosa]